MTELPTLPLPIDAHENAVGEALRLLVFGAATGAYHEFDPVLEHQPWDDHRRWRALEDLAGPDDLAYLMQSSGGFTCRLGELIVETCWFWDGDGTLAFQLKSLDGAVLRTLVNSDCKKNSCWESHHEDDPPAY